MNPPITTHIKGQVANERIKGIDATIVGLHVNTKGKYIITPIPIVIAKSGIIFLKGFLELLQFIHIFDFHLRLFVNNKLVIFYN